MFVEKYPMSNSELNPSEEVLSSSVYYEQHNRSLIWVLRSDFNEQTAQMGNEPHSFTCEFNETGQINNVLVRDMHEDSSGDGQFLVQRVPTLEEMVFLGNRLKSETHELAANTVTHIENRVKKAAQALGIIDLGEG